MAITCLPERRPPVLLPNSGGGHYETQDISIDYHCVSEDNELYFISPKEIIGFPIGPPARIFRAFDSDTVKIETLMPDTFGCTSMGSQTFVRGLESSVAGAKSSKSAVIVLNYDPSRRQAIEQEMPVKRSSFPTQHNFPALLEIKMLRQSVLDFMSSGFEGGKVVAESIVNLTIANTLESLDKNLAKKKPKNPTLSKHALGRTLEFIEENIEHDIGLNDLGDVADISAFHFQRCFRRTVGKTPHAYIAERRIERAKNLLANTRYPIYEIALACGFSSSSHLAKAFKRNMGVTPSNYREAI